MTRALLVATFAFGFGAAQAKDTAGKEGSAGQPTGAYAGELMTLSAKVTKVDMDKHELTLKDDSGKPFTIKVPESVSRLENVKPGDKLKVSFYESMMVSVAKPGETPPQGTTTAAERARGNLPGGAVAEQVTATAKITKISPSKDELTLEGANGKATTIKIDNPQVKAELGRLKVGDQVQTTFTQAMATSIVPARNM